MIYEARMMDRDILLSLLKIKKANQNKSIIGLDDAIIQQVAIMEQEDVNVVQRMVDEINILSEGFYE